MNAAQIKKALGGLIQTLFPELRDGTHLTHKARVVRATASAGEVRADASQHYSVDVLPLKPDGSEDASRAPILDVPLPAQWPDAERGVFALPAIGSVVLVSYIGGNPAYPYVAGVLFEGHNTAAVAQGEFLIKQSGGTYIQLEAGGRVNVVSTSLVTVDAPKVELAGGDSAVARKDDPIEVVITSGSSAGTYQGRIISGSQKVSSG